ncbi:receptor-like protein EIX1 isoform X2 [Capsicum annuum]|uniref:receptor-like protein EIX1 isoform X2 n=1 Tax=Capsicum annuum TaxID=4072 RepID=UPI001FB18EA0|nr:receptor-like protein EIX1 isoform X2 [Capsicum annuum]
MKMVVAEKFIQRLVVFDICVTLILICGVVFSSRIGDGRTKCLESEKEALLSIKRELLDIHGRISSWGNEGFDQDCCTWRGVSCDNQTGHVIGLDLRGPYGAFPNSALEPLVGKISSAIQELKNLKYLDLSHNQFSGGIPDFIGSLSSSEVGDGKIKCVAIEKEALLRLKEEFLDIHGRLSSCGNEAYNEDCCGWRGVQCDNQTGNVIRLGPHPVTVHIFLLSHCKV